MHWPWFLKPYLANPPFLQSSLVCGCSSPVPPPATCVSSVTEAGSVCWLLVTAAVLTISPSLCGTTTMETSLSSLGKREPKLQVTVLMQGLKTQPLEADTKVVLSGNSSLSTTFVAGPVPTFSTVMV